MWSGLIRMILFNNNPKALTSKLYSTLLEFDHLGSPFPEKPNNIA